MPRKSTVTVINPEADLPTPATQPTPTPSASVGVSELATALTDAINLARPQKKTIFTRKKNTPWTPKDGSPKLALKRKFYQHGIQVLEARLTNAQISLINKLRPGNYCDNLVRVIRRRDKGVDIDYAIKTAPQRLKLVTDYGITSLDQLLERCITEAAQPRKPAFDEFGDAN